MNRRLFLLSSTAFGALAPMVAIGKPSERRLKVKGAKARIEIIDDPWGIPHIRARSKADAFFGQGYVTARDRLFQIELNYRSGLGRLAEVFGPQFVPHDHAARLFQFRGDIDAELAAMPPEMLACAKAYVAGINARLAELEADPSLLSLEFGILGFRPLRWDIRNLVRIRSPKAGDTNAEIRRSRLAARGLLDLDHLVEPLRPAWTLKVPEGLKVEDVSEADLGLLAVSEKPLPFKEISVQDIERTRQDRAKEGSNCWIIAPSRSATGRPILANDPHLGIGGNDPRHVVHLTAPGLDVIGGSAPGNPGIMQGHTDHFAFGRTDFHIDQEDLFILETKADDPNSYRHQGGWKPFKTVDEAIKVKGGPDQTVTLRYAEIGPVISEDATRNRAVALAAVWMRPGANMRFAMIPMNLAKDWKALREAFRFHVSPTNFHYADIDGNIGWYAIGHAPMRPHHDGLMPAPGDGRYDWTGILPIEKMPNIFNPPEGWFASANQMNLPPDYPFAERIMSFSWRPPYRYDRIVEVLTQQPRHSLADSIALQHDALSNPARKLVALLPKSPSAKAEPAVALLRGWDCVMGMESAAATLFEFLMEGLKKSALQTLVPAAARDIIKSIDTDEMLRLIGSPDGAALLDNALVGVWDKARQMLGEDPAAWRWGDLHRVTIKHPLSSIPAIAAAFPPIEGGRSGGDADTVMARWLSGARGYEVTGGASYLVVMDVGAWDNSRVLNLPGQSADPRSPHYRDFYEPWLKADMQPLLFSTKAVNAQVMERTILES